MLPRGGRGGGFPYATPLPRKNSQKLLEKLVSGLSLKEASSSPDLIVTSDLNAEEVS